MEIGNWKICIVGLGLMGGSLAMALRDKVARITAEDVDAAVLQAARAGGVIDGAGGVTEADVVVLAVPSDLIVQLIPRLQLRPGALVVDLGSTKSRICAALDQLPEGILAVGGHPMCGLAENGFRNAIPTLYQGATFVLCETARTTSAARTQAMALATACGAQPLWMARERHDYLTGLTSHVPHVLNFALMRLALDVAAEDAGLWQLAAGGFDGATRLARTDEAMIAGMFSTNSEQVRALLARLRQHVDALEAMMDDAELLRSGLREIVAARRAYGKEYGERRIA